MRSAMTHAVAVVLITPAYHKVCTNTCLPASGVVVYSVNAFGSCVRCGATGQCRAAQRRPLSIATGGRARGSNGYLGYPNLRSKCAKLCWILYPIDVHIQQSPVQQNPTNLRSKVHGLNKSNSTYKYRLQNVCLDEVLLL
jgi:hypothetical protein